MSALAVRTGAINLGQGFPDADGPPSVIASAVAALEHGANQYAPGLGVPALRQAIARHQQRHYGIELDPDREVIVTTGCTEGIAAALLGLIDPGDEVVVLEPYYDSYLAMIEMCGGVRRPVTLRAPDFRLDVDALRDAVTAKTRAILLNTPHNPTGTVLTREELPGGGRPRDRARPDRDHRRGLRAPGLRRSRARPARDAAGDAGADADAVERRQELFVHRLEGRLGDRTRRSRRRRARGEAVADLHVGLTAAARGRARAGPRARLPARRWRARCSHDATCSSPAWPRPA